MDAFWGLQNLAPHSLKIGRAWIFLNITFKTFLSVWKKIVTYTLDGLRVSKSQYNFHFWVNYPFKSDVFAVHTRTILLGEARFGAGSNLGLSVLLKGMIVITHGSTTPNI